MTFLIKARSHRTISKLAIQFKTNDEQFVQEEWTFFFKPHMLDKKCWRGTDWILNMHGIIQLIDSDVKCNSKKWYYHNTKPYEAMTYCCAEFEWYFTDSITNRTLNSQRLRETTGEEWHLHKAEWRPEGSKNRHYNKRGRFAKTANVAAVCQYHLWAQQGLRRVYKWKDGKETKRDWHT